MKLFLILVMLTVVAMAAGQNSEELFKAANAKFSAKFSAEVSKLNPGKSVVMSAYSVLTPLAQISLASDGGSHDELLSAIGMPDDETTKIAFAAANKKLRSIKGVDLKIASRIYIPEDYELNDQFNTVFQEVFESTVKNVNFQKNVATAQEINSWVEDHTNKKIKDFVSPDSLSGQTRAVLVNAIYFKGSWKVKFNVNDTKDQDFWVSKDKKVQVPTMYKYKRFEYGESLELDAKTKIAFAAANKKLRSIKGVDLKIASRIYIPEDYELNDQFNTVFQEVFESTVKNVNFQKNVATAQEINSWVEDHTNKKIKDFVSPDSLSGQTRAVLVNAIYFKGSWKVKFNVNDTKDQDFWVSKDKKVQVPTMYKYKRFEYGESLELDAKLLRLPYEGDEASMLFVLPSKVDGLPELQEKLKDPEALNNAVKNMHSVKVHVHLPKFKIETTTDLAVILKAIGVKKMFDENDAAIDRLMKNTGSGDLYVSEAKQKAFIEVNEEGTEAAAANGPNLHNP